MNQALAQLADLPWSKVLIASVVAGGLYWAALFDDGSRLKEQYNQATQELAEAEKQLKATKEAVANADKFEREVRQTVEQFKRIVEFMPEKTSVAELTTTISDLSAKAGTKLLKTEPQTSTEKTDFYETTRLSFVMEGSFSQIVMFLSYVSRVPRLMTYDRVELSGEKATDISAPRLTFSGTLVSYRYSRPLKGPEDGTTQAGTDPNGATNANH